MQVLERGIDVSYHQGMVNWEAVGSSGQVDFAVIRCGFRGYGTGGLSLDTQFHRNMKGALAAGIPVGVYFFSTAITEAEAREEADYVLKQIEGYDVTYPIVFDYEGYEKSSYRNYKKTTKASRTALCRAFGEKVTQAGYGTLIYGSQGILRSKFDLSALPYDIWCARYAGGYDSIVNSDKWFPNLGEYTPRIAMWQYTSIGRIPGIRGNVDLNQVYKDIDTGILSPEPGPGEDPDRNEALGNLKSVEEREVFCDLGTYKNGSTPETVYADTDCAEKLGSLDRYEVCEALGVFEGRVAVLYTQNGTRSEKVGFVKWLGGYRAGENPYRDCSYQNGSTAENVYCDNEGRKKIGSLTPHERCDCAAVIDGMAVVRYDVTGKENRQKIGFVRWLGGIVTG